MVNRGRLATMLPMPRKSTATPPNRIAFWRSARNLSQAQLGELIDAHWVTVSKLERGKQKLTQDYLEKISRALGVAPADLLADAHASRISVHVVGVIGAGARVVAPDDPGGWYEDLENDVGNADQLEWFEVRGESMFPFLRGGDLIAIDKKPTPARDLIGRLCLVTVSDGERYVKILRRGSRTGSYDLESLAAEPIIGAHVVSCGRIVWVRYGR